LVRASSPAARSPPATVYLTVVAESAVTGVLFVAMPGEAAANRDYLLPTVVHSVQSDESRRGKHIAPHKPGGPAGRRPPEDTAV
jgi:Methane/Phenol/Toluene Hydroxylase